jgi:toxin ParE1/3/4
MRVVLRASAKRDLQAIGDWIARDNPPRAASFMAELEHRALNLSHMSERGPIVAQSPGGPVHKLTHGRYLIYYRVNTGGVEILGFRHGARRPPRFG